MIKKRTYLALLFDFYHSLLTDKQKLFFDLYYNYDLSLGEIAEEYEVSRQAVYDAIKRVEVLLLEYEEKLKMAKGFLNGKEKLEQALKIVNSLEENLDTIELKQLLETVLRENY